MAIKIKRGDTLPTNGLLEEGQLGYYRIDNSLWIGYKENNELKVKCIIPNLTTLINNITENPTFISNIVYHFTNEGLTQEEIIEILNTALEGLGPDIIQNIVENLTSETIQEVFETLFQNDYFIENIVNNLIEQHLTEEQISNILDQVFINNETVIEEVIHNYLTENSIKYVKTINGQAPDNNGNINIQVTGNGTYSGTATITVGGIQNGDIFLNNTIQEVFDRLIKGTEIPIHPEEPDPDFVPVLFYGVYPISNDYIDNENSYTENGDLIMPEINWSTELNKYTKIEQKGTNDISMAEVGYHFIAYPQDWGTIIIKNKELGLQLNGFIPQPYKYNNIDYYIYSTFVTENVQINYTIEF